MGSILRNPPMEFLLKPKSQVQRLLQSREDIFDWYTKDLFEDAFTSYFKLVQFQPVGSDGRVLYYMEADA